MAEVSSIIYFWLISAVEAHTHKKSIGNPKKKNIKDSLAIKSKIWCMERTESIHYFSREHSYLDL